MESSNVQPPGSNPSPVSNNLASAMETAISKGHKIYLVKGSFESLGRLEATLKWVKTGGNVNLVSKTMLSNLKASLDNLKLEHPSFKEDKLVEVKSSNDFLKPSVVAQERFRGLSKVIVQEKLQEHQHMKPLKDEIIQNYLKGSDGKPGKFATILEMKGKDAALIRAMNDLKSWERLGAMKPNTLMKYLDMREGLKGNESELKELFDELNLRTEKGYGFDRLWERPDKIQNTETKQVYENFKSHFENRNVRDKLFKLSNEVEALLKKGFESILNASPAEAKKILSEIYEGKSAAIKESIQKFTDQTGFKTPVRKDTTNIEKNLAKKGTEISQLNLFATKVGKLVVLSRSGGLSEKEFKESVSDLTPKLKNLIASDALLSQYTLRDFSQLSKKESDLIKNYFTFLDQVGDTANSKPDSYTSFVVQHITKQTDKVIQQQKDGVISKNELESVLGPNNQHKSISDALKLNGNTSKRNAIALAIMNDVIPRESAVERGTMQQLVFNELTKMLQKR